MNFIEFFKNRGDLLQPPYKLFLKDMNFDGQFTSADVIEWFIQAFFFFGDTVIYGVYKYIPAITEVYEIGWDSYHGVWSFAISSFFWLFIIATIRAQFLRD
jgi:hypothetical protein